MGSGCTAQGGAGGGSLTHDASARPGGDPPPLDGKRAGLIFWRGGRNGEVSSHIAGFRTGFACHFKRQCALLLSLYAVPRRVK